MIPFYHIMSKASQGRLTSEQHLARRMAHLPQPVISVDGNITVDDFLKTVPRAPVGLVFDNEFWYAPACWKRWLAALVEDGLENMLNAPLGNQAPGWRDGVVLSDYATLHSLEQAADSLQAARWKVAVAGHPVCFCVIAVPPEILSDVPSDLPMQILPRYWAERQHMVRLFGGGWLHAFNALRNVECRHDLLGMVDWKGRVLELGCAQGVMAQTCKQMGNPVVWFGLDSNLSALLEARRHVDLAIQADASAPLPFCDKIRFDRVVCGDFLEHLAYPWRFLERLRSCMAPDGLLVASFPNVGHWSIVKDMLAGRWDEIPSGTLCVTHLRFGTKISWQRWLEDAGWNVIRWESEQLALPDAWTSWLAQSFITTDRHSLETLRYRIVAEIK